MFGFPVLNIDLIRRTTKYCKIILGPRRLLLALQAGVSGREQSSVQDDGAPGTSKSEVSRLWQRQARRFLSNFANEIFLVRTGWR